MMLEISTSVTDRRRRNSSRDIYLSACAQRFYVHGKLTTVRINFRNFLVILTSAKIFHSKLGKLM